MRLKCMGMVLGIMAVLLISGCTEGGPGGGAGQMSFECEYMSLGWLGEFSANYYVMPQEAIQCDNARGSFIVLELDFNMGGDIASSMTEELINKAVSEQLDYYDEICSSSGAFCAESLVAGEGKITTAEKLDDEKIAIIVVNSVSPGDAAEFLDGFWQNRNPAVS